VHEEGDVPSINGQLLTPPPEGVGEFTRLKTQYVWGPGDSPTSGVMELLRVTEITKNAAGTTMEYPRVVLYDAQGDVAALVQPPGVTAAAAVTAQWTWSPYGEVLTYEEFYPHQPLHVGHKGLFVDRLNSGPLVFDMYTWTAAERPRLEPGAKLIAHTPNRTYAPDLGRWLQQDPNASGQSVVASHQFNGSSAMLLSPSIGLGSRVRDGLSMMQYARGNPITWGDALGLYSTDDLMEDVYGSNLSIPGPSDFISGMLESLVSDYAANLEWDIEWALDWSMADDDHTRNDSSWIWQSMARGVYEQFEFGIPSIGTYNPLESAIQMAGSRRGGGGGGGGGGAGGGGKKRGPIATGPGPYRSGSGPYGGKIAENPTVTTGGRFSNRQINDAIAENKKRNGGELRCDVIGRRLVQNSGHPNSVEADHILPAASGGSNSSINIQLVSRS